MKSLQKLVQDHKSLDELMIEAGGELTSEEQESIVDSWMQEISGNIAIKADSYKYRQDSLVATAENLKARAKMFSAAAKVLESMSERLKDRMKFAILELGSDKIEGHDFVFKISESKPKMVINESEIDGSYYKEVIERVIDKDQIKKDIEDGKTVRGVSLEPVFRLTVSANKKIKELK